MDERMPFVDDAVIANLHRTDLGDAIAVRPGAGRLDIDHHVILRGVETVIDPADLGHDASGAELAEAGQLVTANHIPFRLDLHEGRLPVLHQHQVGETVSHPAEVVTHAADDAGDASRIGSFEQRAQRVHLHVIPAEYPIRAAPFRCDGAEDQRKSSSGRDGSQLLVNRRGEQPTEAAVLQAMG